MATKPTPGASDGTYGTELNAFLDVSLDVNGFIKTEALQTDATAPSADAAVANKLYVDGISKAKMKVDNVADATWGAGSESSTEANGKITKAGITGSLANGAGISFAVAFPGDITSLNINPVAATIMQYAIKTATASGFTVTNNATVPFHWQAIGY